MHRRSLTVILTTFVVATMAAASASAQSTNPRFGVWQLRSDAPPPSINIMTYEPYGDGGMSITVESTNSRGESSKWGYVTMFDGEFHPVEGRENADTSVEVIDERTTRISNRRDGRITQVIINQLTEDGQSINNEYIRFDENGKITRVSHAIYDRIG